MSPQPESFEALIEQYAYAISSALRKVLGSHSLADADDIRQEVMLAIWKQLESGKKIDHPASYIYKTTWRAALAWLRRRDQELGIGMDDVNLPIKIEHQSLNQAERQHLLEQSLSSLDQERQRAVRAYLMGFNHKEIAQLFGWTESTARHRVYRAIDELKQRMEPS